MEMRPHLLVSECCRPHLPEALSFSGAISLVFHHCGEIFGLLSGAGAAGFDGMIHPVSGGDGHCSFCLDTSHCPEEFPRIPPEDLEIPAMADMFLTRVFSHARFRFVKKNPSFSVLTAFHASMKYLLMALKPSLVYRLGAVAANPENREAILQVSDYELLLRQILKRPLLPGPAANAYEHIAGFFKTRLSGAEKREFAGMLSAFRSGKLNHQAPRRQLLDWAAIWKEEYILRQVLLRPYPEELVMQTPSRKRSPSALF